MTGISKADKDHVLRLPQFAMATGVSILVWQTLHSHRQREKQRGFTASCFKNSNDDQRQFLWPSLPATTCPARAPSAGPSSLHSPELPGRSPFKAPCRATASLAVLLPGGPLPPTLSKCPAHRRDTLTTHLLVEKGQEKKGGDATFQVLRNPLAT